MEVGFYCGPHACLHVLFRYPEGGPARKRFVGGLGGRASVPGSLLLTLLSVFPRMQEATSRLPT